jgi:dCMP deaminase
MSLYDDVLKFHEKFGLPRPGDGGPTALLDEDVRNFRIGFMKEELVEFEDACLTGDLADAFDAMIDLVYVALGTAAMMRVPFDDGWAEVQRANMAKERAHSASDPRSTRGHSLDVVKPEGWRPPDIEGVLLKASIRRLERDRRGLALAAHVAGWSKDPTTKVGAVIVGKDPRDLCVGYNGFPPGIADTPDRLMHRPTKHALTQHAERNALDNAHFDIRGATLYTTLAPCVNCAKSIVSKGISRVVCAEVPTHEPWADEAERGKAILEEAGVVVT